MTKGVKEDEAGLREAEGGRKSPQYAAILTAQKKQLFGGLEGATTVDAVTALTVQAIESQRGKQAEVIKSNYLTTGSRWAENATVKQGATAEELINETLERENIILREVSLIEASTADQITTTVGQALVEGASVAEIQTAILSAGIFEADRALRIARTVTGSAASLGQLVAGEMAGATKKVWQDSGFGVRDAHAERDGEKVGINGRFSTKLGSGVGPRWPGDPQISAADRINCRCSLTFE